MTQFNSTIQDLDQEADRLADKLEEHIKEKRKQDFEILLLKGELEKRKKYPRGVPPGPSPEEVREQRERDAEKAQNDAKHRLRRKQAEENRPLMVHQMEVRANLTIDCDYYRKQEAARSRPPKALGCNYLDPELQCKIRATLDRAKAAGRPIDKLTNKMIRDIMKDKL